MKKVVYLGLLFLSLILLACNGEHQQPSNKIDTYDRVMSSGKIRCSYYDWPPVLQRDPNTNQFSGVGVDVMNEIAARLKLKVSWDEESGPGTVTESVKSGRVDMICLPIIITMARARVADFSEPVMFGRFYPWVKQSADIPADANMNDARYKFVYIDGSAGMSMVERLFPKAQDLALAENVPTSDLFLNVMGGKADAAYADTSNALTFDLHNPGQIKPITNPETSVSLPWAFMTAQDNYRFVQMINLVLHDMRYDGTLDRIMRQNKTESYFTMSGEKPLVENSIK